MSILIDNSKFAAAAYLYRDSHIPYSKLDCQAFVERVLADCGVSHNWKGSNHMWRDALTWKGTAQECADRYGSIPPGAWLFTVKHDGGETKRGYHDDEGNAAHVGIFVGPDLGVMHSTTGGVQCTSWPDPKRWTHVGLCKYIAYPGHTQTSLITMIDQCIELLQDLKERIINNDV